MKKYLTLIAGLSLFAQSVFAGGFQITSPQIANNGTIKQEQVFNSFGCTGGNVSPELKWKGAPSGTKSFAVTVYDPDAPTGSGWWHWVVFNIPANSDGLAANTGDISAKLTPADAIQSRTDFGKPGYGGPCPPAGDKAHRYQFTVYALKVDSLPLDENAPAAMVGYYIQNNMIGKAVLNAKFGR